MNPLHLQVESSDLIAYGLIPEFVGRFPILVNLSALTEDQLVQVIFVFFWNKFMTCLICDYDHFEQVSCCAKDS